jgi:hypothetical protein
MRIMTEDVSAQLITDEIALTAAREAFLLAARAPHFVVVAHCSDPGNRFTVEAGATKTTAGVKIGSGADAIVEASTARAPWVNQHAPRRPHWAKSCTDNPRPGRRHPNHRVRQLRIRPARPHPRRRPARR